MRWSRFTVRAAVRGTTNNKGEQQRCQESLFWAACRDTMEACPDQSERMKPVAFTTP